MRFITLDSTPSTNLEARKIADSGDLGPLWVRADVQFSGRGRRGRDWVSPKGNLYCTGLYPHDGTARDAALLSFVTALAVYDLATTYVSDNSLSLKWPNDVLFGGAKCSGILLESGRSKDQDWVLIGVGVNLVSHPPDTPYPATDFLSHMDKGALDTPEPVMTGPDASLAILAGKFNEWRDVFVTQGFAPIRSAWLARAANIPGPVTVSLPNETYTGQAIDLGVNGELQVRVADGTIREVHAGDVFFGPTA